LAAFGEELAFRGYLMNRLGGALGGRPSWVSSLVTVSLYFGIGHGAQGLTGIIQESLSGVWLGVMFLLSGRNLTIPIVARTKPQKSARVSAISALNSPTRSRPFQRDPTEVLTEWGAVDSSTVVIDCGRDEQRERWIHQPSNTSS
jgi:hypothetical protein